MKIEHDAPKRRPGMNILANPLFRRRIVRDKKKYFRKGRKSSKKFEDSIQPGNGAWLTEEAP